MARKRLILRTITIVLFSLAGNSVANDDFCVINTDRGPSGSISLLMGIGLLSLFCSTYEHKKTQPTPRSYDRHDRCFQLTAPHWLISSLRTFAPKPIWCHALQMRTCSSACRSRLLGL
ncbi:hypothetical protein PLICRDRAFT_330555 [Plicaturopsis crispa FD-325 SS-3]|uniref:Uncharacterized protein n=1 Tax=Plicaturopsis crispa FD-325 SS-3 TaxID=944288 RepID=A0A0C9SRW0_PLICR|nr:hypothetical protein PLICRDRAFT_330555 [Plicaturopsis crispa FD-325 SS-3]